MRRYVVLRARYVVTLAVLVASLGAIGVASSPPAGAEALVPETSDHPMTMPVSGMVESLVGGGCPSGRSHPGIDISNPAGTATEVYAAYGGTAYALDKGDGYGLRVEIVHPFDGGYYLTRYAHLSQAFVTPEGQPVEQGDPVGMMGATGNAQIVHLHFEVRRGTTPGSDVALDVNSAFRPCRRLVAAGAAIPIDFAPLTWVPRRDAFTDLVNALLGSGSSDAADASDDASIRPRRRAPKPSA